MGCQFASEQNRTQQPHRLTLRQKRSQLIDPRKCSTKFMDVVTQNVTILRNNLEKAEISFASKYLSEHEFFSTLTQSELNQILGSMVVAQAKQQQYIFYQGEPGNSFFLIYSGQVDVQIDNHVIRTLSEGKSFGQLALLFRTSRTASIKAKSKNNIFLVMKPALFRASLKKMKIFQMQKNKKMIENVQIFQGLTNKQRQALSQNLKCIHFKKGQTIFKQGDPATSFYIISTGQVQIQIPGRDPIILRPLQSFGQNSFRNQYSRVGTAIANQDTSCSILKKSDLDSIFGEKFDNIFFYNLKKWALVRSQCFQLDANSITTLISKFQIKFAKKGDILVQRQPQGLIINLQGKMNGKVQGTLFCQKSFLDRSALSNPIIKNDDGHYAYISWKPLDNALRQIQDKKLLKGYSKKDIPLALDKQNSQLFNLTKFKFLKQLGEGQFGKVYLVKNDGFGGNLFAVKCLSKQEIKKQAMEKCVIQEKKILTKIIFPYIVGFAQAFHDQKNIYFLMEYIKGKQMFDVIREMPFLNKKIATYFFGCLFLAIEHLHENNIIYRDIKPQNSVVDYTGKAFLIDLGTAKALKKQTFYRTFTMIGTPHYMAPQIIDGKGYSFEVDIWSMGIILYEFVFGCLPFGEHETDPYAVMKKVKTEQVRYSGSSNATSELKQVLNLLLQKNPKVRSIKSTFQIIKNCAYFSQLNWSNLMMEKITPPYVPKQFRKAKTHQNTLKMQGKPLGQFLYGSSVNAKKWVVNQWNQEFSK